MAPHTIYILYHYLRLLKVKVSYFKIQHLLDTPLGDTMRGISDALDELHIENAVYQLPSIQYIFQLHTPFITLLNDEDSFCIVTRTTENDVDYITSENEVKREDINAFKRHWTGTVLTAQVTQETQNEKGYIIKNLGYHFKNRAIIVGLIALISLGGISFYAHQVSISPLFYLGIICSGVCVSMVIVYKEHFNEHFLNNVCQIGKNINCNRVLKSKGASLFGFSLGELSLSYFLLNFAICVILPHEYWIYSILLSIIGCCFTVYSLVYQSHVLHQICLFCITIDCIVWLQSLLLLTYGSLYEINHISLFIFLLLCIADIAFTIALNNILRFRNKAISRESRMNALYTNEAFTQLLHLEPSICTMPESNIVLKNNVVGERRVLFITNPNCSHCASIFTVFKDASRHIPISLLFMVSPHDKKCSELVKLIIATYKQSGWEAAMFLLQEWYDKKRINATVQIDPETETICKAQLMFCLKQQINKTPVTIVDCHYVPEVYRLSDLRYVLT